MSLTIAGSVEIGRPLFPSLTSLGNIVALRASIDRCLLDGWLNLSQLQAQFPERIQTLGSMVSFQGPVAIIEKPLMFKVVLPILLAIATLFITGRCCYKLITAVTHLSGYDLEDDTIAKISEVFAVASALVVAGLVFFALPTEAGVYFLT